MNIDEVFSVVHNLGVREALRRFKPKYTIVVVSPNGTVVEVQQHKIPPEFSEVGSLLGKHKGCGAFVAAQEMYPTVEKLQQRVSLLASKLRNSRDDGDLTEK